MPPLLFSALLKRAHGHRRAKSRVMHVQAGGPARASRDLSSEKRFLAGGVDSPVRAGKPVNQPSPLIVSGEGSHVRDADGREYIDYVCAYGPVLLGHADPRIAKAAEAAMRSGAVFGTTHPEELRLAERICRRFPSMERVRFVSTGTEACMSAVRVARAFTQREKIIRFSGCYHGQSDEMIFSAGASSQSRPTLACGVPAGVVQGTIVLPYNDVPSVEAALLEHGSDTAAVIVEPICANMGLCMPDAGFLEALRRLTRAHGALLIFDEVITAFRCPPYGAGDRLGVRADITCIGKALGGGLPIAAFGGKREIMEVLAPEGAVFVGGTFSGNPACVAAAHAFLDALESDGERLAAMHRRAHALELGLCEIGKAAGLDFAVVRCDSIVDFMFRTGPAHRNMREAVEADAQSFARYYRRMLKRGILVAPSQMEVMFLTASHTDADIELTLDAARYALS
jgi:glutamate-1-semialdehyde 2,1-aminomutase